MQTGTRAVMRGDLIGSTVTLTSLGRMGGIVRIRTMMNLSGSFDHRFVDGFDAGSLMQEVKARLEHPATLFLSAPDVLDG